MKKTTKAAFKKTYFQTKEVDHEEGKEEKEKEEEEEEKEEEEKVGTDFAHA